MNPLTTTERCACFAAVASCGFCAFYEPTGAAICLAALLWALGGWKRDPLWWLIASLVWLRGATISAGVGLRIGLKGAVRTWDASQAEAYKQAWKTERPALAAAVEE